VDALTRSSNRLISSLTETLPAEVAEVVEVVLVGETNAVVLTADAFVILMVE